MKKKTGYIVIISLIFSFSFKVDSSILSQEKYPKNTINAHQGSCSIITCTVGDNILYGYNHDGHEDLEPYILFGDHLVFSDGDPYYFGKPMCNTGRMSPEGPRDTYASLTTDGLCFAFNSLSSIPMYMDPQKVNYSDIADGYGPMYKCSTVEEVIAFYNQYNYFYPDFNPDFDLQWSWQNHYADAEGNATVVGLNEFGNVTITKMNESQYLISTNLNLAYPDCCDGPCSYSAWRIEKANEMLHTIVAEETLTVNAIRDVLEAISVDSTVHSLIFNPKTLDIYVYYRHDFSKVFKFNLEEELSKLAVGEYKLYDLKKMYDKNETIKSSGIFVVISAFCFVLLIIKTKRIIIKS